MIWEIIYTTLNNQASENGYKSDFGVELIIDDDNYLSPYLDYDLAAFHIYWYLTRRRDINSVPTKYLSYIPVNKEYPHFNSNYGYYWFSELAELGLMNIKLSQYQLVVKELLNNPYTRRASILMRSLFEMYTPKVDFLCTEIINFNIHQGYLNMHVKMRSSNLANLPVDVVTFMFLFDCVYFMLPKEFKKGQMLLSITNLHMKEDFVMVPFNNQQHLQVSCREEVRLLLSQDFSSDYSLSKTLYGLK
jgi:thymidylate synthase